jgi:dTDP-4-dehydrorhamnose reductase
LNRILLTGATGLLGPALWDAFRAGNQVLAIGRRRKPFIPAGHWRRCDIRNAGAVQRAVRSFRPQIIVHAAALSNIDYCEQFPDQAYETNTAGTQHVVRAAADRGAYLIYVSTDNVFDGRKPDGQSEKDRPNPLNSYGFSKLWGENHVRRLCRGSLIVRTSWLFGPGPNFVTHLLEGRALKAARDWVGCPTYTVDLAKAIRRLAERKAAGLYHVTNASPATRWEVVRELRRLLGRNGPVRATPCRYKDLPFLAQRPINSVLRNARWRQAGLAPIRSWKSALQEFVAAYA